MSPSAAHSEANGDAGAYKVIPLAYDSTDSEISARQLIFALYPEWEKSEGHIEFERFKDGITNTLFKAIKKRPGLSEHEVDQTAVLLRAYGNGTQVLIDREREAISHSTLASIGLAPPLLARFENGLLYSFIEGTACSAEDLRRPEVYHGVARLLGQWHSRMPIDESTAKRTKELDYPDITRLLPGKPTTTFWSIMQKWILALPNSTKADQSRNAVLQKELGQIVGELGQTPGLDSGKYVQCHCDLLCGNVIVPQDATETPGEAANVSFIDYEYTTPGPAAFDIANHFAEWGGLDCDYGAMPTRSQRLEFIHDYVSSYRSAPSPAETNGSNGHGPQPTHEDDIKTLMQEVDNFRGIPGFFWGIWALIQTQISQIDFDYAKYADQRLGEYWAWKGETDGSRTAKSLEMPLRERRWAQES